MHIDLPGKRQSCRQQHRWPDHRVEPEDVLADDMAVRRPAALSRRVRFLEGRDVAGEGIEPDIENVLRIAGKGDSPVEARP